MNTKVHHDDISVTGVGYALIGLKPNRLLNPNADKVSRRWR